MIETRAPVPDHVVDGVRITSAPRDSHYCVLVETVEELRPVKTFLESVRWSHIDICARNVVLRAAFAIDLAGFDFGDQLEPDEQPFEGARFSELLSVPPRQVIVSLEAFDRLMLRHFDAMASAVPERNPDVLNDPRWLDFLKYVEALGARTRKDVP